MSGEPQTPAFGVAHSSRSHRDEWGTTTPTLLPLIPVIQRLCPRCRTVLHLEDETTLVFCYNCSAPQVRLSAELLEEAEAQRMAVTQQPAAANAAQPGFVPPVLNRWTGAIQCAALAGAVAAALTLISFAVPPVELLTVLWVVSAPIVVLGVYAGRFQNTRITAGFAARLGILCGLAILACLFSLDTVRLCLDRSVFHATAELDTQLATLFAQQDAMVRTTLGDAQSAPGRQLLQVPEFRAGILLCSFAMLSAVYILYSAAAGAFAGLLRSRTPTTR